MWLRRSLRTGISELCSDEGTRSPLALTEGRRAWYVQISFKEPLSGRKWELGRWTILGSAATPGQGRKSMRQPDFFDPKRWGLARPRNNSR
jgi:hypothetical protein